LVIFFLGIPLLSGAVSSIQIRWEEWYAWRRSWRPELVVNLSAFQSPLSLLTATVVPDDMTICQLAFQRLTLSSYCVHHHTKRRGNCVKPLNLQTFAQFQVHTPLAVFRMPWVMLFWLFATFTAQIHPNAVGGKSICGSLEQSETRDPRLGQPSPSSKTPRRSS
jgi:hypothetical protein